MSATTDDIAESRSGPRRKWWLNLLIFLGAPLIFLCLIVLSLPTFDRSGHRLAMRETGALTTLRTLAQLQTSYAAAHPAQGFACQLRQLKPAEPEKGDHLPNEPFATGTRSGYKFALIGCEPDAIGVARRYQFTAAPVDPGHSAIRAFCVDQTNVFWYDPSGSAETCLTSRRPLPE